jgi:16S rRNA (guanine966-N2)-methyltransferase
MRIISGKYKGRKLYVPKNELRPTKDFTREALFNIINIEGKSLLELFAGSGSVGIEALSRNASTVTFVDQSIDSVKTIDRNLELIDKKAKIIKSDIRRFLELNSNLVNYDFIFLDPPYKTDLGYNTLIFLDKKVKLNDTIIVIYEHSKFISNDLENLNLDKIKLKETRDYGKSSLSFFIKNKLI